MGRRCVCSANAHHACPICSGLILCWRTHTRRRDNSRRREPKPRRCCGSTRGSQLKDSNVFSSTRTPRMSSTVFTGCARRGCRRLEHPSAPLCDQRLRPTFVDVSYGSISAAELRGRRRRNLLRYRTWAGTPSLPCPVLHNSRNLHFAETPAIYGENALCAPRARGRAFKVSIDRKSV